MAPAYTSPSRLEPIGHFAVPAQSSNSLNQRCATFARPTFSNHQPQKRKGNFAS
jgi:hypothetical protein